MNISKILWNCSKCQRNRTTNFCQECGTERPPQENIADLHLSELRLLIAHERKVVQGKWNAHVTLIRRGFHGDTELMSYEKHKRFLSAAEWALAVISDGITQSKGLNP